MDLSVSPLSKYSSLTDAHLSNYFSSKSKRRHLKKAGLISANGFVLSEDKVRYNFQKQERKRQIKTTIAQAIVEKTLEIERQRQAVIQQKLEEIAKLELVRRIRAAETDQRRRNEDFLPLVLKPPRQRLSSRARRPSLGPSKENVTRETSIRRRPTSAPISRSASSSHYVNDDGVRCINVDIRPTRSLLNVDQEDLSLDLKDLYTVEPLALSKYAMALNKLEKSRIANSPYTTASTIPLPPKSPRIAEMNKTRRRNSDRPYSASRTRTHTESVVNFPNARQNMTEIVMKYHGWKLSLVREKLDPKNMVIVEQQHCGGNTLVIFKGRLLPNTHFTIFSHRHRGFPFSLTIYVDGRMDSRVSTCCEYRHALNVRLGGAQGHFSFTDVRGNMPCYKCQVEMERKRKKTPQPVETEVVNTYNTDSMIPVEIIEETCIKEVKVPVEPLIVGHELELEHYYDEDFEEPFQEPTRKINLRKVENVRPVSPVVKDKGGKQWTTEVEPPNVQCDTAMTYTFLKKDDNNDENPLSDVRGPRQITITDDNKWVITVQGPPPPAPPVGTQRKDPTLIKQTTHEVTLHKNNRSLISIQGESCESDDGDEIKVIGCQPDVREEYTDSDSESTLESEPKIRPGSRNSSRLRRSFESGSSTQTASSAVIEKKVKRTKKRTPKRKEKTVDRRGSIEDEIESAEELLKQVDSYINTADEVSDIENEVASPRGPVTDQDLSKCSSSSKSTSRSSRQTPDKEDSSIHSERSEIKDGTKNHQEDVYRSRTNLYMSDMDDPKTNSTQDNESENTQTPKPSDATKEVAGSKNNRVNTDDDSATNSDYSKPSSYSNSRGNDNDSSNSIRSNGSATNSENKDHSKDGIETDSDNSKPITKSSSESNSDRVRNSDSDKIVEDTIDSNLKSSLKNNKSPRKTTSKSVSFDSKVDLEPYSPREFSTNENNNNSINDESSRHSDGTEDTSSDSSDTESSSYESDLDNTTSDKK